MTSALLESAGEHGVISYMEKFLQFIFVILFAKNYVYVAKGDITYCLWHFQVAAPGYVPDISRNDM